MSIYDKLGAKTAGIKARSVEKPADTGPKTAPGMFLNSTQRMDAAEAKVEALEAQLKTLAEGEIALELLHEVPGRRRELPAQKYAELKENLRHNPLIHPIVIRPRTAGGYEIISGGNRVAVYRDLARTQIPYRLVHSDDERADRDAFYANLLQSDLFDFEKYMGFQKILERKPELTHGQLAQDAGISRSTVTQLMAFGELPAEAVAVLKDKPDTIGANAAQDFAGLVKQGRAVQVTQAIIKIAKGEIEQGRAVKEAALDPVVKLPVKKDAPVRIKVGKVTYCDIQRADKVLRIQFQSSDEAVAIQSAVKEMLEARAKTLKS